MKFQRILVPVDYSGYSREALRYAAELACTVHGELVVLHIVEPVVPATPGYAAPMTGYGQLHKEMVDGARQYLDDLKPLMEGVPHRGLIRSGEATEEIVKAADEEQVDVIVMATHGRTGLSRLFMGSTCEAVVRQARVPVLTLRAANLAPSKEAAAIMPPPRL